MTENTAPKLGTKKTQVTKKGVRGETYRKTVYKPTVDGRVVGTSASDYEAGALKLAAKWLARRSG